MARAKTASFYIRRTVDCSQASPQLVTIDTSAYVDPADRQGVMIESVDYVFFDSGNNLPLTAGADEKCAVQLLTGAYTTLQSYDEEDMISSGGLIVDGRHHVRVPHVVDPGNVLVPDSLDAVSPEAAHQQGRALQGLGRGDAGPREPLFEVVAGRQRTSGTVSS